MLHFLGGATTFEWNAAILTEVISYFRRVVYKRTLDPSMYESGSLVSTDSQLGR